MGYRSTIMLVTLLGIMGCQAGAPGLTQPGESRTEAQPAASSRTVVFMSHVEPSSLSEHRAATATGGAPFDAIRLFNAALFVLDNRGISHPYLVERKPELNTESWRVFADGHMETTYQLRPDLTWHDGAPFTADDMVLSWRVLKSPELGVAGLPPTSLIDEAVAVDARTLLVRWSSTYTQADALNGRDWAPLPSHLLASTVESRRPEAFHSLPYWTHEFVGLGPFRIERYEPGAFIDATAFAAHALGRPKLDRIQLRFVSDPNAAVANLLAGDVDVAIDYSLGFEQAVLLKREWAARNAGSILLSPDNLRYVQIQSRPIYASPAPLLDLRVRKALAYAIDKQALVDGLLDGEGQAAEGMFPPLGEHFEAAMRTIMKYPYDLRQTERLLQEAGLTRGGNGFYTGAEPFSPELRGVAGGQEARENAILSDVWRRAGIDVQSRLISDAQYADREFRSTFPALSSANSRLEEDTLYSKLHSGNVPTAATRW